VNARLAALVLLMTLVGCQGANDVTGPVRPDFGGTNPERTIAAVSRMPPVVIPGSRREPVTTTRPQPTPRLYPCLVAPGQVEWKNKPCEPCLVVGHLRLKNKPCYQD
jgi:hypothetical protein